jgi:hypothetical protein
MPEFLAGPGRGPSWESGGKRVAQEKQTASEEAVYWKERVV